MELYTSFVTAASTMLPVVAQDGPGAAATDSEASAQAWALVACWSGRSYVIDFFRLPSEPSVCRYGSIPPQTVVAIAAMVLVGARRLLLIGSRLESSSRTEMLKTTVSGRVSDAI